MLCHHGYRALEEIRRTEKKEEAYFNESVLRFHSKEHKVSEVRLVLQRTGVISPVPLASATELCEMLPPFFRRYKNTHFTSNETREMARNDTRVASQQSLDDAKLYSGGGGGMKKRGRFSNDE